MTPYIPDLPSFALCAIRTRPLITRYAAFMVRNKMVADTIADTVLLALWDSRNHLQSEGDLRCFIHRNTRSACHAWLHQQVLSLRRSANLSSGHPPP